MYLSITQIELVKKNKNKKKTEYYVNFVGFPPTPHPIIFSGKRL